jgi:hypothetical protein
MQNDCEVLQLLRRTSKAQRLAEETALSYDGALTTFSTTRHRPVWELFFQTSPYRIAQDGGAKSTPFLNLPNISA